MKKCGLNSSCIVWIILKGDKINMEEDFKFKVPIEPDEIIYTATRISDAYFSVTWDGFDSYIPYKKSSVDKYIKDGNWIILDKEEYIDKRDKMTNYERFKSLTLEELAEELYLNYINNCYQCPCDEYNFKDCFQENCDCISKIIDWLKKETINKN